MSNIQNNPLWAIYYESDAYSISGEKVMGRQAAGNSFLKAYALSNFKKIGIYAKNKDSFDNSFNLFKSFLPSDSNKELSYIPWGNPSNLNKFGGIFYPAPDISKLADQRYFYGSNSYSVVGITHTTASDTVINSILDCYTRPLMPWDALICTSKSVKRSINNLYDQYQSILSERIGATKKPSFELPIIPLGVHLDDYSVNTQERTLSRNKLNIKDNDIALLFLGRLSFHAKAHHLPMYIALQKVAESLPEGVNLHIIQSGWFPNDVIENIYKEEANKVSPLVSFHFLDGRDPIVKKLSYAVSDIFISLVDNFQETFGLTPLEGMASGLPAIVSDWDGYRDTVRDKIDGFRIPTVTMEPGSGNDYALRYSLGLDTYDHYIGRTSQTVSIDLKVCIDRILSLAINKDLRQKLGNNAKERAREFEWKNIISQYSDLKIELDQRRKISIENNQKFFSPAMIQDPYTFFDGYSSIQINLKSSISLNTNINNIKIEDLYKFSSVSYLDNIAPKIEIIREIYDIIPTNSNFKVFEISEATDFDHNLIFRSLIWLAKFGYISINE